MSLLVVEDDPLDQILLKKAFSRVDVPFQYEFCDSAEDALDRLETGKSPRVIMTDLRMPGMGGLEFLSRLNRQDDLGKEPPQREGRIDWSPVFRPLLGLLESPNLWAGTTVCQLIHV